MLATAREHDTLGLHTSPDAVATLVTLYSGALFTLVGVPGDVDPVTVRRVARAIVRGVEHSVDG